MVDLEREMVGVALMSWREWLKAKLRPKLSAAAAEKEKDWLVAGVTAEVCIFVAYTIGVFGA